MKKYLYLFLVTLICVSCQSAKKEKAEDKVAPSVVETPNVNFREHVVVKGGDSNHVIYEYSDVRVDDVASLAIEYCARVKPNSRAELHDIYMYKNHKRRATFNCSDIAQR